VSIFKLFVYFFEPEKLVDSRSIAINTSHMHFAMTNKVGIPRQIDHSINKS